MQINLHSLISPFFVFISEIRTSKKKTCSLDIWHMPWWSGFLETNLTLKYLTYHPEVYVEKVLVLGMVLCAAARSFAVVTGLSLEIPLATMST